MSDVQTMPCHPYTSCDAEVLWFFLELVDEGSECFHPDVELLAIGGAQEHLILLGNAQSKSERLACLLLRDGRHGELAQRDQPSRVTEVFLLENEDANVGQHVKIALPVFI